MASKVHPTNASRFDVERSHWNVWARLDPMYAILVRPDKERHGWNLEDFFAEGRQEIRYVLSLLEQRQILVGRGQALDFGCGLGRLSQALAAHFDHVCGVDASTEMIRQARVYNQAGDRCTFELNQQDNLRLFDSEKFDLIYSNITLQHIPPPSSHAYIREFVRLLKPEGTAVFQLPTDPARPVWENPVSKLPRWHPRRIWNKLRMTTVGDRHMRFYRLCRVGVPEKFLYDRFGWQPPIPMYSIDTQTVSTIVASAGGVVVDTVRDDGWAGQNFISHLFIVRRGSRVPS
jgi:SAM-dependent methyltransferase